MEVATLYPKQKLLISNFGIIRRFCKRKSAVCEFLIGWVKMISEALNVSLWKSLCLLVSGFNLASFAMNICLKLSGDLMPFSLYDHVIYCVYNFFAFLHGLIWFNVIHETVFQTNDIFKTQIIFFSD